MNLIVRRARLVGKDGLWDIGIAGDRIVAVGTHVDAESARRRSMPAVTWSRRPTSTATSISTNAISAT